MTTTKKAPARRAAGGRKLVLHLTPHGPNGPCYWGVEGVEGVGWRPLLCARLASVAFPAFGGRDPVTVTVRRAKFPGSKPIRFDPRGEFFPNRGMALSLVRILLAGAGWKVGPFDKVVTLHVKVTKTRVARRVVAL